MVRFTPKGCFWFFVVATIVGTYVGYTSSH